MLSYLRYTLGRMRVLLTPNVSIPSILVAKITSGDGQRFMERLSRRQDRSDVDGISMLARISRTDKE